MKPTQQKLDSVKLMLNQAIAAGNDYKTLIGNLNAFLSEARSVTLVMQKEGAHKVGFPEWYELKIKEMVDDPDFKFFKEMRNVSLKERPITTSAMVINTPEEPIEFGTEEVTIASITIDENGYWKVDPAAQVPNINGVPITNAKIKTEIIYAFIERPLERATDVCQSYLSKLEKLVVEFYEKFAPR